MSFRSEAYSPALLGRNLDSNNFKALRFLTYVQEPFHIATQPQELGDCKSLDSILVET